MTDRSVNDWIVIPQYPIQSFTAPTGKVVYVNDNGGDEVAIVLRYIAERWHNEVEPIAQSDPRNWYKPRERKGSTPDGDWDAVGIHSWRPGTKIAGTNLFSNHCSATCLDINGHLHPYEKTYKGEWYSGFTQDQKVKLRQIASSVRDNDGNVLIRLGLDFAPGRRDGMHVEIGPGVTRQQVREAAAKLRPLLGIIDLTEGAQMLLDLGYTGDRPGCRAYQTDNSGAPHKLVVDGKLGPKTFAALKEDMATVNELAGELAKVRAQQDTIEWAARLAANRAYYQGPNRVISSLTKAINEAVGGDTEELAAAVSQAVVDGVLPPLLQAIAEMGLEADMDELTAFVIAEITELLNPAAEEGN